eukprot:1161583-Pelagomonas_calceolata.AAC.12
MVALGMPTTVKKDLGGDWACHLQEMFPHSGIASRLVGWQHVSLKRFSNTGIKVCLPQSTQKQSKEDPAE